MGNILNTKKEKRKGNDIIIKCIKFSRIFAWVILFAFLIILDQAKPHETTFFDRLLKINVTSFWNQNLVYRAILVAIILFTFSLMGLVFNTMRLKRKSDHISISLLITLGFSILIIILYLLNYFS